MSTSLTCRPLTTFLTRQSALCRNYRPFSLSSSFQSRLRQPGEPTGPNEPPTHTTSAQSKSPLKVWPIVLILITGSLLFKKIVDDRKGQGYQPQGPVPGLSPAGGKVNTVKPSFPPRES